MPLVVVGEPDSRGGGGVPDDVTTADIEAGGVSVRKPEVEEDET